MSVLIFEGHSWLSTTVPVNFVIRTDRLRIIDLWYLTVFVSVLSSFVRHHRSFMNKLSICNKHYDIDYQYCLSKAQSRFGRSILRVFLFLYYVTFLLRTFSATEHNVVLIVGVLLLASRLHRHQDTRL